MPNLPASAKLGRNSIRCLDKHKTSAEQNNFVSCAGKEQSHSAGDEAGKHKQRGSKSVFSHLFLLPTIIICRKDLVNIKFQRFNSKLFRTFYNKLSPLSLLGLSQQARTRKAAVQSRKQATGQKTSLSSVSSRPRPAYRGLARLVS